MPVPKEHTYPGFLWAALHDDGLLADTEAVKAARREMTRRGRQEIGRARAIMGSITWWRGLWASGYPWPHQSAVQILGVGHVMTEFLIAPLHLSGQQVEAAVQMGMHSNLIATFYDAFVDYGYLRHSPVPESVLAAAVDPVARRNIPRTRREEDGPYRFMVSLITAYFDRIDALPYAGQRTAVVKTLISGIQRMYHAQNQTAGLQYGALGAQGHRALRRKAIYPIMVMGLPAWLIQPDIRPEQYRWHLRWLCRLGAFLGWVDDAVDLWLDFQTGQPNAISDHRAALGSNLNDRRALTRQIAAKGRRLLDEWTTEVGDSSTVSSVARNALATTLYSWFGGPPDSSPRGKLGERIARLAGLT